jgi:hypothetical protein
MDLEPSEKQTSKYPKLHIIQKIAYVVIWPIGMFYLIYCFLLFLGVKPTKNNQKYRYYQESGDHIYSYTYKFNPTNPFAFSSGSSFSRSTHRS